MKKSGFLARGRAAPECFHNISSTFGGGRLEFIAFVLDFIHGVFDLAHGRGLDALALIPLTVPATTQDYNDSNTHYKAE